MAWRASVAKLIANSGERGKAMWNRCFLQNKCLYLQYLRGENLGVRMGIGIGMSYPMWRTVYTPKRKHLWYDKKYLLRTIIMRLKSLLAFAACVLCCISSFGQRQQTTVDYYPYPNGLRMIGKKTYSYIIGEDGENLKDGAFSISAKPEAIRVTDGFTTTGVSSNGHFRLNTSFAKGNLNGAFTFSYSTTLTQKNLSGTVTESHSMTFNGNFSNGLPHGAFNIQYKTGDHYRLVANYNKGVLVGSYSSAGSYRDLACVVKGTLTSKGEMTGRWTISNIDTNFDDFVYEFQNGVLVRKTTPKGSTKPSLTALAKKYAAGTISEEELLKHNVVVLVDSFPLGKYSRNVIFRDDVLDWEDVGGYDFSHPNNKKYKYLKEEIVFTDKGLDKFCNEILSAKGREYSERVRKGDVGYYVSVERRKYENLVVGVDYSAQDAHYWNVFLTDRQIEFLKEKLHDKRKQNVISVADLDYEGYAGPYSRLSWSKLGIVAPKIFNLFNGVPCDLDELRASAKKLYPKMPNLFVVCDRDSSICAFIHNDVEEQCYKQGITDLAIINNGILYVKNDDMYKRLLVYIAYLSDNYDEFVAGASEEERAYFDVLKEDCMSKINECYKESLDPVLKFMLTESTPISIAYDDKVGRYFSFEGFSEEYPSLEFSRKLKSFGKKLVGYEVVGRHGENYDEVECILAWQGKKKIVTKYKVIFHLKSKMVIAKSIDVNNATIIVE